MGQQQARLYADCLENQFGQRPVIFYSNGYEHWIWDDVNYPPRVVQGFDKKTELELLVQRRSTRKALASTEINPAIVERFYQTRGIRRIAETVERDLVIIDEAHRSVFQKYRAIFDDFDSLLVGLTATPKDEVDRNTYSLFELENGIPTDAYSLEEAVRDGFLVASDQLFDQKAVDGLIEALESIRRAAVA